MRAIYINFDLRLTPEQYAYTNINNTGPVVVRAGSLIINPRPILFKAISDYLKSVGPKYNLQDYVILMFTFYNP